MKSMDGVIADSTPLVGTELYLDVTLNQNPIGLARFGYDHDKLYASADSLRKIGLRIPANTPDPVCLNDLPQLRVQYDANQQTLALMAPLQQLDMATTQVNPDDTPNPDAAASRGLLLNYDLYASQGQAGQNNASAFSELRAFSSVGVLSSTQISRYTGNSDNVSQNNGMVRLDTSWRTSFPRQAIALNLGDMLTSAVNWSRPTRIAGIQIGTDYSLQPYTPTTPLPSFFGSATLPSSVELYMNGVKYYNGEVPAGNFELNTLPNINGAGEAQVTMTDALGKTTVQSFSFYNDQSLLRQGLSEWSAEVGVVRNNYGYESFDYASTPAFSGTWRHGLSNSLTAGGHAEATESLINAGFSSDWIPGSNSGTISTALAASADAGKNGFLYSVGYRWNNSRFNFSTTTIATAGDYHDVATRYGSPPPSLNQSTVVGYNTESFGSFSVGYLQYRSPGQPTQRYTNANWYQSVSNRVYLTAGLNQNVDRSRDRSIFLVVNVSFDNNINTSTTVQRSNNDQMSYSFNASKTQPSDGGLGWNMVLNQQDNQQGGQGELGYLGRYGKVYGGYSNMSGNQSGYAGANGALVLMGGGLFASQTINNGFAVVSTGGMPNVPVLLQNNPIGTSNDSGLLLVTPLNSYQKNEISINPMDLPANMRIDPVNTVAIPADRSGTMVNFTVKTVRSALIVLKNAQGEVIPEGSSATLNGVQSQSAVVGFDGMVYFDTLDAHNTLNVVTSAGRCTAQFDYPEKTRDIPQIGPLTCQ
ncbi:fimbria/pilus outer membrane usher protein [Kluyvera sp. 142486]|uniref:fimbria/pilus outer membrane usher protein n=1 Tax=Kluyvera sp. 142486 TaxID=3390050 RepID=UPI00397EBAD7